MISKIVLQFYFWLGTYLTKLFENTFILSQDYTSEKKAAVREFEEKKIYLKEQLIAELEEKQKMIDQEHI